MYTDIEYDFNEIAETPTFIDKSSFLKYLLSKKGEICAFLAPRGMGKTTNLSMAKEFFQAHVDWNGEPLAQETSPYYNLFCELEIGKSDDKSFVKGHHAKYPVLSFSLADFLPDGHYMQSMQATMIKLYKDHDYLAHSKKLSALDKGLFKSRLASLDFLGTELDLTEGKLLLELMYKHFNKTVFIFVDEFDAPVLKVKNDKKFMGTKKPALEYLSRYLETMTRDPRVFMVAITAATRPTGMVSDENSVKYLSTFDDDTLSKFFGFTDDDLKKIAIKLGKKQLVDEMCQRIESYRIKDSNKVVYNTMSVIKHFNAKAVQS